MCVPQLPPLHGGGWAAVLWHCFDPTVKICMEKPFLEKDGSAALENNPKISEKIGVIIIKPLAVLETIRLLYTPCMGAQKKRTD